ncbi:sugar kinase [Vampirovibrio chlorellavorus]|uniref:sugar kinase n=1 Tax=Vampirovibrio chlorellavorus TaxID=758823 RepID=UPI0026F0F7A1|nr:sugar kinase [Vampirovibrio chlorellavorus]
MLELSSEGDLKQARVFNRSFGGDTLNTAVAAARLGSNVGYITRLGNDAFALALQEMILKEGIQISPKRNGKGPTGLYFVSVDHEGQRDFVYYRQHSAATQLGPDDISVDLIKQSKIVYSSGITLAISPSARQATLKAFRLARENGVMTAFDPNYREALWESEEKMVDAFNEVLPWVDIFLPSFPDDTVSMINFNKPQQVVDYFLFKGVKLVVVKVGAQGCYLGYKREIQQIPSMSIKAIDTTGAGDAFNGGFLHGLAQGESLINCAKLGITTASLKVLNRGSAIAMPNRDAVYNRAFSH